MERRNGMEQTSEVAPPTHREAAQALLAIYPSIRQSGWAILAPAGSGQAGPPNLLSSGAISLSPRGKIKRELRISHLVESLGNIADVWRPGSAVCSIPGGMNWDTVGTNAVVSALRLWASTRNLTFTACSANHVRSALAGKPNASKGDLELAVMHLLGAIGQVRSAIEWEAVAVGCIAIGRHSGVQGC